MLKLGGKVIQVHTLSDLGMGNRLFSISTSKQLPISVRRSKAYIVADKDVPSEFAHYLIFDSDNNLIGSLPEGAEYTLLPDDYKYLGDKDVIRIAKDREAIRVLFRASSPHNGILVTEQCNHYCLMCSQPPKAIDDSWMLEEIHQLIPLIPRETKEINFTGGEPTLYGERFLDVLRLTKNLLPYTGIHILSNGRSFSDASFAEAYAAIQHPDMMVGIPIYSDDPAIHDYVVQAEGAFDETIRGILNLKRLKQKVEVRVVLHQQTIPRLAELSEFLVRNLLFVDHVALMGLEMMGFTRANLDKLWIDPWEYRNTLSSAVSKLAASGMSVSVYNHQLCLVNEDVKPYYRKSISDWKNEFASECEPCLKKHECGGFFASGIKFGYSLHLKPFTTRQAGTVLENTPRSS